MARNIALTLTIDGVQQTITTIGQLETAITQAKAQLAGLEIGSTEFAKLSTQIRQADSALKNLQESVEGKKIEETIGRYAKIGSAITGSFAAAQAAISLFGTESEEVARAATQAQNLLTIALTGREVAEASVAGATLIADLATKAQTASTLAADSATKRFYATLAANPYTALLVGVGLLIGALVTLGSKTDDAAKKQKEFNEALNKDIAKEVTSMKLLVDQVNNMSLSLDTRKKRLEELQNKFPSYFKNLKEEDILSGKVKVQTDLLTDAIIKNAQARALQGRVEERAVTLLNLDDQIAKQKIALQNAKELANTAGQGVTGGGSVIGMGGGMTGQLVAQQRLGTETEKYNKLLKQKSEIEQQNAKDISKINTLTEQTDTVIGATTEKIEDNTDAQKKNLEILQLRLDAQIKTIETLSLLNETEGGLSKDLVETAKKIIEEYKQLSEKRSEFFKSDAKKLKEEISELLFSISPTQEQSNKINTSFISAFADINTTLREGSLSLIDENGKAISFAIDNLSETVKNTGIFKVLGPSLIADLKKLDVETQKSFVEFFTRFSAQAERLAGGFNIAGQIIKFDKNTITKNLTQAVDETIKILNDPAILPGLKETEISKVIESLFSIPQKTLSDFGGDTEQGRLKLQKYNEGVNEIKKNLTEFARVQGMATIKSKEYADEFNNLSKELLEIDFEPLRNAMKMLSEGSTMEDLINAGVVSEKTIKQIRLSAEEQLKIVDLISTKIKESPAALAGFLQSVSENYQQYLLRFGQEGLSELLMGVTKSFDNLENLTEQQLNDLLIILTTNADKIKEQYGDKVAKSFEDLVMRVKKALADIPSETEKEFQKSLEKIASAIQTFQSVITQIQQTTSDYYSFQLDQLDKQNESIQKKIVGDTEEANKKRLEQEQIYQAKRKELEKRQAKTSLSLQLVQGVANTALAITRALAEGGPIAGPILAGILGGIGAIQVGLIGAQLAAVDKYKRGGFLKMEGGGWVSGPSHEYGGVKFAAGGFELEGNEAVINRQSSLNYMGLLDQINQSGGGKPIFNNFDDSRIVEAIYKQRSEPIRAYVVESDITNKQQVTRRLEQLAQF